MNDVILAFTVGVVVSTIVWYFVLRNNKKKIQLWLETPEQYFNQIQSQIGDLSDEAKGKMEDIIAEIKRRR
jgi:hypothetical protein